MLMLGKELLSGLWVRPECRSFCCHFHTRPCLTLLFHRSLSSHHFRCDPALSVFASKCQGECHAWTAALCDLGDPGWGYPWFLHWALLLLTPSDLAPGVFAVVLCFAPCQGPLSSWHTRCHHAWISIAGSDPTSWCSFGCFVVAWFAVFLLLLVFCWLFFLLGLPVCFCGLFCVFGFLAGIAYWTAYRSITSTFVAIDSWQPCTIISIHLLLRSNVCNDLAEAMKALDGKKAVHSSQSGP